MDNPTSVNQTKKDNALPQTNNLRTYDEQTCSSSSRRNNNTEIRWLWNYPTAAGTHPGTYLDLVDGNRSQSVTPHGISHSERAPSGNNLTLEGSPLGTYLPNSLSMLGNSPPKQNFK